MDYEKGYVYELMDQGGPTDVREAYFKEAVDEMMRARTLCAKANASMPDDPTYVSYLEELFGRKLGGVRILTPFICDFGNRVTFGKGVFINHSAILSASGGIEFEDGCMAAPDLRIATINHDMNERHTTYTYDDEAMRAHAKEMVFPIGAPNDAYAKYFVGKSYLAPISTKQVGIFNVTFEPGCRNNWHIHHADKGGGQILVCVAGRGYYQEEGKNAVEMKPGDSINIPVGVKLWHGAAPDSWFSHLAIEVPGENGSNEWLEAVSDEQYNVFA